MFGSRKLQFASAAMPQEDDPPPASLGPGLQLVLDAVALLKDPKALEALCKKALAAQQTIDQAARDSVALIQRKAQVEAEFERAQEANAAAIGTARDHHDKLVAEALAGIEKAKKDLADREARLAAGEAKLAQDKAAWDRKRRAFDAA